MYTLREKKYTGPFLNGHFEGKGMIEYGNGDVYTGEFHNGKRHGKGLFELKRLNETIDGDF